MKVSGKVVELVEEIRKYRTDGKLMGEILTEKESLKKQNKRLEENFNV